MTDDAVVQQSLERSLRVMQHCESVIQRCSFSGASGYATLFLLSRMLEFQRAARCLLSSNIIAPVAIMVLVRALYESHISFRYLLLARTDKESEEMARRFLAFGEHDTVAAIGDDRAAYRSSLSARAQAHFDRRIQIADDVKRNFTKEQRTQGKYPTWNGKSIREMAKAVGAQGHDNLYGVMSMVEHGSPAMSHKSVTFDDAIMLCQPDYGRKDGAEWLDRSSRLLLLVSSLLLHRQGMELNEDDSELIEELHVK